MHSAAQTTPFWISFLGPFVAFCAAVLAATFAWRTLHTGAAINLRNKRVDVISGCNTRYDSLAMTKTAIIKEIAGSIENAESTEGKKLSLSVPVQHEIDLYHRRYWGLKSDQIDYWLAGYVDPETLVSWFMSTIDTIHNPVELWGDYGDTGGGWESVKSFHETTNKRLYQIVEAIRPDEIVKMHPQKRYAYLFELFRTIEHDERGLINMLKRNSRERLTMKLFRANLTPEVAKHVIPHELRAIRQRARRLSEERKPTTLT